MPVTRLGDIVRLAAKLTSGILVVMFLLLVLDAYLSVRRDTELALANMERDALLLGHTMERLVLETWHTHGEQRAMELFAEANRGEHQIDVRWVWLDAATGGERSPLAPRAKLDPAVHGKEVTIENQKLSGGDYLITYIPVRIDGSRPTALELSEPLAGLRIFARTTIVRTFLLATALLSAAGLVVLTLGTLFVGRPLHYLVTRIRQIGQVGVTTPLVLPGHDELAELARALNTMHGKLAMAQKRVHEEAAAKIEAIEQLRHADRLKTAGVVASGIAHELGSPLNVISARAKLIAAGDLSKSDNRDNADVIVRQSERMADIIRQLLDFARLRAHRKATADLSLIVNQAVRFLTPLARKRKVEIRRVDEEGAVVLRVDGGKIQQVLTNLIVNAVQAMPHGGLVLVDVHHQCVRAGEYGGSREGRYAFVSISDNGEGIPRENMERLFEPFFTTKDVGEGTGLGLSVAHGIVREHGGWIDVESEPGKGSCFSVYLPEDNSGMQS